ncbi:hypothetical protein CRG98_034429 [Punica granatum]|uniref:RNase H type-1 domain-containing protein n=2 Tax=Punica granatum TaxID=22663 RepID=A0A2I0IME2_PUNGR|nr:hypothetical protein CRG98_034429 [Punica granatum]
MKVIKASEYKLVEQMGKSPAHISLLALLLNSKPHRDALLKVHTAARVPKETTPDRIEEIVNSIFSNQICFADDELSSEGQAHLRALHIVCKCNNHVVGRVVIDNGSALNVWPVSTLKQMNVDMSRIRASKTTVRAFDGSRRVVNREIDLPIDVGPCSFSVTFQILEIPNAFSLLLGRPWIHATGAVPSSLHQKLKFFVEGKLITINGKEDYGIYKEIAVLYINIGEEDQNLPFHSFDIVSVIRDYGEVGPSQADRMIGKARRGKHLHRLAAHYRKFSRGIPVPPLSQFFPVPPMVMGGTFDSPITEPDDFSFDAVETFLTLPAIYAVTEETSVGVHICPAREDEELVNWTTVPLYSAMVADVVSRDLCLVLCRLPGLDPSIVKHFLPLDIQRSPPKCQHLRRQRADLLLRIKEEVIKQMDAGFLEVCNYSEWVANIAPMEKKNDKVRVCIDYRDLNRASPKDNFLLPYIDVLVDNIARHTQFSFMDGFSGYNQIQMAEDNKIKTTFITMWGTFCYKVMPFGLKNAGATYQQAMVTFFHDMMHKEMTAKSKEGEDHLVNLKRLFDRLKKYKFRLNPTKCTFGDKSSKLLGFVVNEKGIEVDPDKVKAIMELPLSIDSARNKCQPLFRLLRKNAAVEWDDECQKAFDIVKSQAVANHLAEFPIDDNTPINSDFPNEGTLQVNDEEEDPGWKMYFDGAVNSTGSGIGAVLISHERRHFPVAAKINFPCTNNIAEYEACILGLQIAIDLKVKELEVFGDSVLTIFQTLKQWKTKDPKLVPYHEYLEELIENFDNVSFTYTPRTKNQFADALATLASMAQRLMEEVHEGNCGPYMNGLMLAKKLMRLGYFWSTMETDCVKHVRHCHLCQIYTNQIKAPPNELRPMAAPWPFSMWGMDVIGPINPVRTRMWNLVGASIACFWITRLGSVHFPVGTHDGHA